MRAADGGARRDREVRFTSGRQGTYHYWATSFGAPIPFRELSGAFVVDPPDGEPEADRIFVITEWSSMSPAQVREVMSADDATEAFVRMNPRGGFMINGRSWPATERLTYQRGETVRWRLINLSSQVHPMHLHGFYFVVESVGDGMRDLPVEPSRRHPVVTQLMRDGGTMEIDVDAGTRRQLAVSLPHHAARLAVAPPLRRWRSCQTCRRRPRSSFRR